MAGRCSLSLRDDISPKDTGSGRQKRSFSELNIPPGASEASGSYNEIDCSVCPPAKLGTRLIFVSAHTQVCMHV